MNDSIKLKGKVKTFKGNYGTYFDVEIEVSELLKHRADLEALLAKPEPGKLVKGAVCRVWDDKGVHYEIVDKIFWNHAELLDWETLGYTLAQNYPEAEWFVVIPHTEEGFRFWFLENEPKVLDLDYPFGCVGKIYVSSRVTLPSGVDWRTTKRRIERI